ncbi:FMN-binding protein [Kribbia dieselivorans]|uniref:FMN-binding protein n=1 Tax=Kribbia dieselivorans TaxID=331526 RepID=UPI00278C558E|nr:FMN-binding protein [Kribbia dieselivorans]
MTQFGNVQVQITVKDGKVVTADAIQVPDQNGRDQAINAVAVPQLNAAAVQAQSANIDMISGASYTSQGYISSLQSALDQAHL